MQTFLPYKDFQESFKVLDYRRLGKQRIEAATIYKTVSGQSTGWLKHPATQQWLGYENALAEYTNIAISTWKNAGYSNTMEYLPMNQSLNFDDPWWLGLEEFHSSHRSNLLRKDPNYYGKYGWNDSPDAPYFWPSKNLDRKPT